MFCGGLVYDCLPRLWAQIKSCNLRFIDLEMSLRIMQSNTLLMQEIHSKSIPNNWPSNHCLKTSSKRFCFKLHNFPLSLNKVALASFLSLIIVYLTILKQSFPGCHRNSRFRFIWRRNCGKFDPCLGALTFTTKGQYFWVSEN